MDYFAWENDEDDENLAWLQWERIEAFDEQGYDLSEGVRCADWFPQDLVVRTWVRNEDAPHRGPFDMRPGRGGRLTDYLPNNHGLLPVSPRLKTLIEAMVGEEAIEFLPMGVRQGETVHPYYVANVLTVVDGMDLKTSEASWVGDRVFKFSRLKLRRKAVPKDVHIFRLSHHPSLVLVSETLGQAIVDADCDGMLFCCLEDFGVENRPNR